MNKIKTFVYLSSSIEHRDDRAPDNFKNDWFINFLIHNEAPINIVNDDSYYFLCSKSFKQFR